jgi:hypothetical protein
MSRGQSFCWSVVSRSVGYRVLDYLLPCYFLWCVPRYYREGKLPAELRGWHSREPILDAPLPPGQGRGTHCRVVTGPAMPSLVGPAREEMPTKRPAHVSLGVPTRARKPTKTANST